MYRVIGSILLTLVILATYIIANSDSTVPENSMPQQPISDQPSKNFNL